MNTRKSFIIGIGGAYSAVGKTTLAAALINHLTKNQPPYPLQKKPKIGAIKYTKSELYSSLIDDEEIINHKDKDTGKLSSAGAEKVLWIQALANDLEELIPIALTKLSDMDAIVIEGNSAIEFARPDIVIFIFGESEEGSKPSAEKVLAQADIVVVPNESVAGVVNFGRAFKIVLDGFPKILDEQKIFDIITAMENSTKLKELERMLKEKQAEGRLNCAAARKIAEELKIPYKEVGKLANELKIKIKNCELGCF